MYIQGVHGSGKTGEYYIKLPCREKSGNLTIWGGESRGICLCKATGELMNTDPKGRVLFESGGPWTLPDYLL